MQRQSNSTFKVNIDLDESPKFIFLVMLVLMSIGGLVGSDMYLSSMPSMNEDFSTSMVKIQMTMSIYLLGLAFGQLVYGPLSESFGRKKIILIGMFIYCISSILCAASESYELFLLFRVLQACGACAGLVVSRSVIGDLYDKQQAGLIFSKIFPFVGMSPAISPAIGSIISGAFSWRACFLFIGAFAAISFFLVLFNLKETLPKARRQPFNFSNIFEKYCNILTCKSFYKYVLCPCFAYIAYFGYLAQSPYIFHTHGFSEKHIGFFYITLSLSYVAGNLFGKRALKTKVLDDILSLGYKIFLFGAILFFTASILKLNLVLIVLSMSIMTFANGQLIPLGVAGVISTFRENSGYASALLGFFQLSAATLSTASVAYLTQNTLLGLGLFMLSISSIGYFLFKKGSRRTSSWENAKQS